MPMLMPKRVKYRKAQRGRMKGIATRGSTLAFGDYGLKALEPGWVTNRQIEAARVALTRSLKRGGKVWIRVFPDKPVTKKPAETRMGKGKGNPEEWVAVVKPGRILYEMIGVPEDVAASRSGRRPRRSASRPSSCRARGRCSASRQRDSTMKAAKWRDFSQEELQQKASELTEEIFNLRFQLSMGVAKNPSRLSQAKKDLARANTVLRERKGESRG